METVSKQYRLVPTFGDSFGTGWNVMSDNFLRLFLVVVIMCIIAAPINVVQVRLNPSDFHIGHFGHWNWENIFRLGTFGIFAAFYGLMALLYSFLAAPVFRYGSRMMFVQAVRHEKPDFETLIKGFRENYLSIVLANLLVTALVALGLFALIIPGIIIGCRLAFVSYIIMDKKVDPIEAVEMSWKLTRGHGWTIFLMGFVSFFLIIFGMMMLFVGIFPALIWIGSSFATLYQSVIQEKEKPAEQVTA
jgi:uncharacterized membrane protein